jgi:hypothetical protein
MPKIGDRVEVTNGPNAGKTGTMIDLDQLGRVVIKLDVPELFPLDVTVQHGLGGVDTIVVDPSECRAI